MFFMSLYHFITRRHIYLCLALFCSISFLLTSRLYLRQPDTFPTGDEPHYLIISQTLLKYHSLDVMLDYKHGDYTLFYPKHLDPHITPNRKGQLLSSHGIGGPLLWLIPFALFGRRGVVYFISLVSVAIILNIYLFLRTMEISKRYAFVVSLAYALASPFYIYSHLTFIDPIAALLCIYVFRKIFQKHITNVEVFISAVFLGLLPWIHIRFAPIEITLFLGLLYKIYLQKKRQKNFTSTMLSLTPVVLLFLLFELYNYIVWGTLDPAANQVNVGNIPFHSGLISGLLWLFFDQQYGLLFNFPLFFLLLTGIFLTMKKKFAAYHLCVLLASVPYLLVIATLPDWIGGYSPPARFVLILLPMYSFYLAYALEKLNNIVSSFVMDTSIFIGFVYNFLSLENSFNRKIGRNITVANTGIIKYPLAHYLPSAFLPDQKELLIKWLFIYLCISLLLLCSSRSELRSTHNSSGRPTASFEGKEDARTPRLRDVLAPRPEGSVPCTPDL